MSVLARGLSTVARRAGLARNSVERAERERQRRMGWRGPLDQALLQRLERLALLPRYAARGGLGGEHRSRARAGSIDFADYRAYRPGDDFRQIDWNVYSRLDQFYVKQTEARERLSLRLMLDCSASMEAGQPRKFDYARQLAAALGYVALARYDEVSLMCLPADVGRPCSLRGKRRFGDLLANLDALRPRGALFLDAELAEAGPSGGTGQVIFLSDMLHPSGYQRGLDLLVQSGLEPSVIQLLSPQELEPEAGGDVQLVDLESGERLEVGLSPPAVAIYRTRLAEWCGAVETFCAARGMRYLRVSTDEPLERVVLVRLREARILS